MASIKYQLGRTGIDSSVRRAANFRKAAEAAGEVSRYLEIGVCEGWSGRWWIDNVLPPGGLYVGIDIWADWPKDGLTGAEVRAKAQANLQWDEGEVQLVTGDSSRVLASSYLPESFDAIYIDGDHRLMPVLCDSVLSWGLLRIGGVMVWDDYGKRANGRQPKTAVDSFLGAMRGRYEKLFGNWQYGVRKTKHMTSRG